MAASSARRSSGIWNEALRAASDAAPDRARRIGIILLIGVLAGALAYRLWLFVSEDFPLNDGGLFLEFVRASARAFPDLPATISYNGETIPFAYPPLSFWISGLLARLGAEPLTLVRTLPILVNIFCLAATAWLLVRTSPSRLFAGLALLFFCVRLRSFEWLVMGGGLSRGIGALFFTLALVAILASAERPDERLGSRNAIMAGLAAGGAMLSHLEWGLLAAGAVALAVLLRAQSPSQFFLKGALSAAAALLVVLPWVAAVLRQHGLAPFEAASGSGSWEAELLQSHLVFLVRTAATNPLLPLGALFLLMKRQFFWPGLLLLALFLTPRHGGTAASLPLAVLSAAGAVGLLAVLTRYIAPRTALAVTGMAVLFLAGFRLYRDAPSFSDATAPLSTDQRAAMAWVRAEHSGARFLIVSGRAWEMDRVSEWFPVLARANSVGTVQGSEWLPAGAYAQRVQQAKQMNGTGNCQSISSVAARNKVDFIWIEAEPDCMAGSGSAPVHERGSVKIYEVGEAASQ
jgi:hypothetical protein